MTNKKSKQNRPKERMPSMYITTDQELALYEKYVEHAKEIGSKRGVIIKAVEVFLNDRKGSKRNLPELLTVVNRYSSRSLFNPKTKMLLTRDEQHQITSFYLNTEQEVGLFDKLYQHKEAMQPYSGKKGAILTALAYYFDKLEGKYPQPKG